jgi:S1-C subfamily serine protease
MRPSARVTGPSGALLRAALVGAALVGAGLAAPPGARAAAPADELPAPVLRAFSGIAGVRVRETSPVRIFRGGRFRREAIEGLGAGSGVAVAPDLILTNAHVAAGGGEIHVRVPGRPEIAARVVSVDEASDLALLRVPGGGLQPLAFASGPPAPGDAAYVLGNRGDRGTEVAWARLGGHARVRAGARAIEFWSEVEAPIGPGNSGGAVLNPAGEILGIPSLIISYTEGPGTAPHSSGLFVPASHARRALQRMLAGPRPAWAWIGVVLDDPLLAQGEGRVFDDHAAPLVRSVLPGSPAAAAGVRRGDRILAIGARAARDNFAALDAVLDLAPGATVTLRLDRRGAPVTVEVETAERPADPRPDPLDEFLLHTGVRLRAAGGGEDGGTESGGRDGARGLAFAGMSALARRGMPAFEAEMFADAPALQGIVPGQGLLENRPARVPIDSAADLREIVPRCFVDEQFVALVHWEGGTGASVDRAYVSRKIYPVVL